MPAAELAEKKHQKRTFMQANPGIKEVINIFLKDPIYLQKLKSNRESAQRNRRAVTERKNGSALSVIDDDDEKATAGLAPIRLACGSKCDMTLSGSTDTRKT